MNDTYLLDFVGTITQNMTMPVLNNKPNNVDNDSDDDTNHYDNSNEMNPQSIDDGSLSMSHASPVDQSGYSDANIISDRSSSNSGGNCAVVGNIRPPHQKSASNSTSSATPSSVKSRRQKQNRQRDRKKSRSRLVKGATNLAKETNLLRHRLDRVLDTFQETVMSAAQSQTVKLNSLQAERKQLLGEIRELEIETFKQASELEDSDELMVQMEERRSSSRKEVNALKEKCYSLAKEVVILKKSLDLYKQTEKAKLVIENKKLESENKSLKWELSDKDDDIRELRNKLFMAKMKITNDKENSDRNIGNDTKIQNSGNRTPKSSFRQNIANVNTTTGRSTSSEISAKTPTGKHRKSSHSLTLRGSHSKKKFHF